MEQYPIPQFIEQESKIASFISFRQFFYLVGAGVICFFLYFLLPLLSVFMFLLFTFIEQSTGGGFGYFVGLKKLFQFLSIFFIIIPAADSHACFSVYFFCHCNPFLCFDVLFLHNKVTVAKKRALPIWERVFG